MRADASSKALPSGEVRGSLGIDAVFVQENQSLTRRGVLRGLHYQFARPQAKLCRVISGEVLDVAVDIRVGSRSFGRWISLVLSAANRRQIFIPKGFAHDRFKYHQHQLPTK